MVIHLESKPGDTVRILRPPPRIFTDVIGNNVWMGEVEPLEFELEDRVATDPYNSIDLAKP